MPAKPSAVIDTRVIYCGDNLDQLRKLPEGCVDLIYIDPPFNSNRNYEVFWGETKEKRSFEDRHESTKAYIDYMRPRCVELHRVRKKTGSFYYHCDCGLRGRSGQERQLCRYQLQRRPDNHSLLRLRTSQHQPCARYPRCANNPRGR
jgi:hypothetical protein